MEVEGIKNVYVKALFLLDIKKCKALRKTRICLDGVAKEKVEYKNKKCHVNKIMCTPIYKNIKTKM